MKNTKLTLVLPVAAALLASALAPVSAGILHKHPALAGAAAGLAAHHMAKKGAAGRAAHGQKPNLAERHPVLSGLAAGGAAHHMLKSSAEKVALRKPPATLSPAAFAFWGLAVS